MTQAFRLIALKCPNCGGHVEADGEDVVYYCTSCHSGYVLDSVAEGLRPVEVRFVSAPSVSAALYLPFWLLPARVRIRSRESTGHALQGLLGLFRTVDGSSGGEETEGTFAVPAFQLPLDRMLDLGKRYTAGYPALDERLGEKLTGGCHGVEDAKKLAEYMVVATEVDKPDTLKNLSYRIEFGEPRLLGVPFLRQGDKIYDAVHRVWAS